MFLAVAAGSMDVGLKIPHLTLSIEAPHHRILVSLGSSGVHLCRHIELLKHVDLPYSKDGSFIPTRIQNTYMTWGQNYRLCILV